MPWKDVSLMSLRLEFVSLAVVEGANIRELCRRFAISPKTAYKWISRHQLGGPDALADQSRRPACSPKRCTEAQHHAILELRDQHPCWGGRKLRARLLALGASDVPAASTITTILRRHGRFDPATAAAHTPFVRFEHEAPNQLWQMDFKGHFAVGSGRCHPLTVLDDHSRYALTVKACGDQKDQTVRGALVDTFGRYGLPERILCDNGRPWGDLGSGHTYTGLSVWLLKLGIIVGHGRPYHPQTQGKDERFHRTLNVEVIQGRTFANLVTAQRRFDPWREVYNHQRPHEALDLAVPASRYRASPRSFPEVLPTWEYAPGDAVRKVDCDGMISYRNHPIAVSKAFRGERVAVRPSLDDGVFGVYFGVHQVVQFDLRVQNPSI
jgi:transposase InsO family protein